METVRKKGRAEQIIEDLAEYGLLMAGVRITDTGDEEIIPIDPENPYKNNHEAFSLSDRYRIMTSTGETVTDIRRLSGIRRWIDSGEIVRYQEIKKQTEIEKMLSQILQ